MNTQADNDFPTSRTRTRTRWERILALAVVATACAASDDEIVTGPDAETRSHVDPYVVDGNPNCEGLGLGGFEFKVEPPNSGTYDLDGAGPGTDTVTVSTSDGIYFDWSATIGMDGVLAKGGPNANVYEYDPEELSDTGLHSPTNPTNDMPYGLSHITFCFDYDLAVAKTADTSFTRSYTWDIDKIGAADELLLSTGQTYQMDYDVVVSVADAQDSDWSVEGEITIYNPAPVPATITSVSDLVDGMAMTVECGVSFPHVLAAYGTLECTYSGALPDGTDRVNEAEVTTSGDVGGNSATADVAFGDPTTLVDDCVDVEDDKYGALGTVCVGDAPVTFEYTVEIGPYQECGEFQFVNTASFETNDTGSTGSDSWVVVVTVPCVGGCTLTPGYWKTHSEFGPAPYDDNWANLPDGASTPFFSSGQSYYEVLWTSPAGNAYYILAHAYIAARLNVLDGADPSAISSALAEAEALFSTYTPTDIAALRGNQAPRPTFLSLAQTLDEYNNGLIGPGHCSE